MTDVILIEWDRTGAFANYHPVGAIIKLRQGNIGFAKDSLSTIHIIKLNWRCGESITTAFVESTVNQVISKRMVKKQQMRWSRRGAHLLLQIRVKELNGELRNTFTRWYPGFDQGRSEHDQAA